MRSNNTRIWAANTDCELFPLKSDLENMTMLVKQAETSKRASQISEATSIFVTEFSWVIPHIKKCACSIKSGFSHLVNMWLSVVSCLDSHPDMYFRSHTSFLVTYYGMSFCSMTAQSTVKSDLFTWI